MPLIVVRDTKQNRDRIINTDNIFHCVEAEGGVKIHYTEGSIGRDTCTVAGSIDDLAKNLGALKVG